MAATFTDTFKVEAVDMNHEKGIKEKQFDKVSRIEAKSENYETVVTIDINTEVYPIAEGDKIEILLSEQLRPAGGLAAATGGASSGGAGAGGSGGGAAGGGGGGGGGGGPGVSADGIEEGGVASYDPTLPLGDTADEFDYIMYGRIFKFAEEKTRAVIYISFGGLLMSLKGETKVLTSHTYKVDSQVYLFIRKV